MLTLTEMKRGRTTNIISFHQIYALLLVLILIKVTRLYRVYRISSYLRTFIPFAAKVVYRLQHSVLYVTSCWIQFIHNMHSLQMIRMMMMSANHTR